MRSAISSRKPWAKESNLNSHHRLQRRQRLATRLVRLRCSIARATLTPLAFAIAAQLAGCTNGSIAAARGELAAGHYAAAHQDLVTASHSSEQLSARERREVADGICLTEYKIGAPDYPFAEQQHACAAAAGAPGSESSALLDKVEKAQRTTTSEEISNAISHGDIAQAEAAIARYNSIPGGDPNAVERWSHQLWAVVNREDHGPTRDRKRHLAPAISEAARAYPRMKAMKEGAFQLWVEEHATVGGTKMLSLVQVGRSTLNLWIPSDHLGTAALNLDRFTNINDALVARCHCDGRTKIAVQGSDLPAYLVRLDPETRLSEVLILAPH